MTILLAAGLGAVVVGISCSVTVTMPGESYRGAVPPPGPEALKVAGALRGHVAELAGRIGERNTLHPRALAAAADYVEAQLRDAGYAPERETFEADGVPCHNLIVEIPGRVRPEQIVVVGAHYDSAPGTPGANDNGSGTAALLVLARGLSKLRPERTLRLVAFVNEEPPYFRSEQMGSWVNAAAARQRGDDVVAMISLETMGYFDDTPGSQAYPFPFSLFYPTVGNFVAFVGNSDSLELLETAVTRFRETTRLPSEGGAIPEFVTGAGWSDHWAYWQHDYPGIMVTDTAPFRYPHYHTLFDTPERIDYDRLAVTVMGIGRVVGTLLEAPDAR